MCSPEQCKDAFRCSRLCCRWCRVRRRDNELAPDADRRQNSIRTDKVGDELYMPTSEVRVPCMVTLIFMLAYIFVGSVAFTYAEEWPVGTAIYFCFVTLSTIGFGDFVPGDSISNVDSTDGQYKLLVSVIYVLLGLAVLSMSINLIQEEVVDAFARLARDCGIIGDDDDEDGE